MGRRLNEFTAGRGGIPRDEFGNPYIGPPVDSQEETRLFHDNLANTKNQSIWSSDLSSDLQARHAPGSGRMSFYRNGKLIAHFGMTKDAVSEEGLRKLAIGIVDQNDYGHFDPEHGKG